MITIKNTQRSTKINIPTILTRIQKILETIGYPDFDIGIWLTTNQTIQRYNAQYRKKNKSTDILSFPYHQDLKPNKRIIIKTPEDKNLGDIIISVAYVKKVAQEIHKPFNKRSFDEHLMMVLIHGICHLLGHTHETDRDYARMHTTEKELAKIVSKLS